MRHNDKRKTLFNIRPSRTKAFGPSKLKKIFKMSHLQYRLGTEAVNRHHFVKLK